jgi:RimJ/RimL family protein N-acetyltransferase
VLETDRTVVRPWRPDEVERAFDIYRRWEVARWLGSAPRALESVDEATAMLQRWEQRNAELDLGGIWAVQRKDDGVVAGTVLLVPLPGGDGELEIGWHLHPDSWGQGLASDAARGTVAWGFARGLSEVFAVVRPDNAASIAVCHRVGLEALGRTSRYYATELELFHGRAGDAASSGRPRRNG